MQPLLALCCLFKRVLLLPRLRSELLQQANRQARRVQAFRGKMQSVERWMGAQRLPSRLQRRIKTFYAEASSVQGHGPSPILDSTLASSLSGFLSRCRVCCHRRCPFGSRCMGVAAGLVATPSATPAPPSLVMQVWIRQHETREETVLFQELPHALRNEVAWHACRRKFRRALLAVWSGGLGAG
jgi:hypothetical protein